MPEGRAGFRIHCFERLGIVAEKDETCRGRHGSSASIAFAGLRVFPGERTRIEIVGQQDFLGFCPAAAAHARRVVFTPLDEMLGLQKKSAAIFQRQKIKLMGVGVVRRRIPVRRAGERGLFPCLPAKDANRCNRPAMGVDFFRPSQLVNEPRCRQNSPLVRSST